MTNKTFETLDWCCRQGLDNSQIGFCEDVHTSWYFGANEITCRALKGKWLYIYVTEGMSMCYPHLPDYVCINQDGASILLFQLD